MTDHYNIAKEELAYYESDGTSLQNMLAVLIGPSAKTNVTGYLSGIGIEKLMEMTTDDLIKLEGIGEVTARRILSAISLSKFLNSYKKENGKKIRQSGDVFDVCSDLKFKSAEQFEVLFLSTKNDIISRKIIFKGSLNSCLVHPREIWKEAIRLSSAAIICVHNHPSGDRTPSKEDIAITQRLVDSSALIGIDFLDHIIIAGGQYYSLKEEGNM